MIAIISLLRAGGTERESEREEEKKREREREREREGCNIERAFSK